MKECRKCLFNDEDCGCICPPSDKWYACPIESEKLEAIIDTEYAELAVESEDKESPVNPQPKTGYWIKYGKLYQCSECKELSCCQGKFCNECGAKMVEPQESEG